MKFCSKCGHQLVDEAVVCTNCGCSVSVNSAHNTTATSKPLEDKPSIGLCVLAALIPLFGFIYWPVCHSKTPIKARNCGAAAVASTVAFWVTYLCIVYL